MTDLATREKRALQYLANSSDQWRLFCQEVADIQASEDWTTKAKTWDSYCKQVFGVSASRIRQHKNAAQLSDVIMSITGIPLTSERQARTLNELAETIEDKAAIHKAATEAAQVLDAPVTRGSYVAVIETIEESVTTGTVTVDGEQIPVSTPNAFHLSVVERTQESINRGKEKRMRGLLDVPVRVKVIDSVAYAVIQLPQDYPVKLLENWIAKVPKPAEKREVAA